MARQKASNEVKPKIEAETICLRMKKKVFDFYEQKAIERTKATGKGVSVQSIINEKLEENLDLT
jgi:hypothetical protein